MTETVDKASGGIIGWKDRILLEKDYQQEKRNVRLTRETSYKRHSLPVDSADWVEGNLNKLPLVLLASVILLWTISLSDVILRNMDDIGLLSVLPVPFYAALVILTISFNLVVFRQPTWKPVLFLHLAALILMLHGTPTILYGTLRYAWAWKHVGIVDYIQRFHQVNPSIPFLDAYHNWPGFFAFNALLTETAGLESSLGYARWAPLFINLLFLGGLYLIYRSFTSARRLVWASMWFFFLGSWVGQDYFAPQSFSFFLYLVLIGILLRWFRMIVMPAPGRNIQPSRLAPIAAFFSKALQKIQNAEEDRHSAQHSQRLLLMAMVILLMIVITFSHQLTPMLVISALTILVIFKRIIPRGLPVLMTVLVLTWMWFFAVTFVSQSLSSILSSFGTVEGNIRENLINLSQASPGQVVVAVMGRGLTLLVFLLAGLGVLRRLQKGFIDLTPLLLVIAPFPILVANSYGGEVLFRVYAFAMPFLAFFIGALFYPTAAVKPKIWIPAVAGLVSLVMLVGFLFSYYGKEKHYYFTPEEVAASQFLFSTAPPGSLIVEGTRNYPALFHNYEYYTYVPISREPEEGRRELIENPEEVLTRWMGNTDYPAAYLIITRSMKAEIDMVGYMLPGSLEKIERDLLLSERFEVVYRNPDAVIYSLVNRGQ